MLGKRRVMRTLSEIKLKAQIELSENKYHSAICKIRCNYFCSYGVMSLLLAFCLCFTMGAPVWAAAKAEDKYANVTLKEFPVLAEQEGIIDLLEFLALANRKRLNTYGTPGLSVGQLVKSYDYINGEFVPTVSLYPIFKNDELYMLAVGGEGVNCTYFGGEVTLVNSLKEILDDQKEFALVFDRLNCYLFDGKNWIILRAYSHEKINDVLDINSDIDTSVIEFGSFSEKMPVGDLYKQSREAWGLPAYTNNGVLIFVDNAPVYGDTSPLYIDDTLLVPVRLVSEELGASVEWNGEQININSDDCQIVLYVGQNQAQVNGTSQNFSAPPQIVQEHLFVPLRFISENLGAEVLYRDEKIFLYSSEYCAINRKETIN